MCVCESLVGGFLGILGRQPMIDRSSFSISTGKQPCAVQNYVYKAIKRTTYCKRGSRDRDYYGWLYNLQADGTASEFTRRDHVFRFGSACIQLDRELANMGSWGLFALAQARKRFQNAGQSRQHDDSVCSTGQQKSK